MYSCKGQTRINTIKAFEEELTKFTLEKFKNNCPYNLSDVFLAESSYYASFKTIGNSGANLMFVLNKENLKSLGFNLKKYTKLENNKLKIEDYNIFYPYKEKLLLLSDVSSEWNNVIGEDDLRNDMKNRITLIESKLKKRVNDFRLEFGTNVEQLAEALRSGIGISGTDMAKR